MVVTSILSLRIVSLVRCWKLPGVLVRPEDITWYPK